MRRGHSIVLSLALFVALIAGTAYASHYALTDVPTLVTAADAEKLKGAGVNTTEELLQKAATAKDRQALAKASKLPKAKVTELAKRCDLLRIKGIGPEMVLLLEASGVKTSADLAKKDSVELDKKATEANKAKKITEKPPTEPQFKDWIDQAKALPPVLEGK